MVSFRLNCISQIIVAGPENEKITCGAKYTYDIGEKKGIVEYICTTVSNRLSHRITAWESDRIYIDWKLTDVAAS